MSTNTPTSSTAKPMLWTGRVLSSLIVLTMLLDSVLKVIKIQPVVDATTKIGFPEASIRPIGIACLASVILYAIPQTTVLGAILLTGYFGGAVATHVHQGESNWYYAVTWGVVTWLGIFLRDARIRQLVPIRQSL